jgi:hypothetical protein
MLKKFFHGLAFGAGFGISLVAIWYVGFYMVAPKLLTSQYEQQYSPSEEITAAPKLVEKQEYLCSPAAYSGEFVMSTKKVLSSGPGQIVGSFKLNGQPVEGLRIRLALNGSAKSQWAESNSEGQYIVSVPYGTYRIDGYELDDDVADKILPNKIDHPQNPHSSPPQEVNAQNIGYGLNFKFVDPIKKKIKSKYSISEEIVLEWEPYPNAFFYTVDIFEKSDPNIWSNKKLFQQSITPSVSEPRINLTERGAKFKNDHFYVVQIYARNKEGEMLSLSPRIHNGYDFQITE